MPEPKRFVPAGTLDGKVVFITGASQGIGLIAAHGFARAGAKVALGARRGDRVQQAALEIVAAGGEALAMTLDVTDEASVQAAFNNTVERFGHVDGLFNNAGLDQTTHGGLADIPLDEWRSIHAVKVDGTFLCTKYAIRAMLSAGRGGSIVNSGSVVSELTMPGYTTASVSQSAITGMTRAAAVGYGADNVRVNGLLIGLIMTPERLGDYNNLDERIRKISPLRRAGTGEDVAQVAAWLLSDYAAYVNGALIAVDGGYLAGTNPD